MYLVLSILATHDSPIRIIGIGHELSPSTRVLCEIFCCLQIPFVISRAEDISKEIGGRKLVSSGVIGRGGIFIALIDILHHLIVSIVQILLFNKSSAIHGIHIASRSDNMTEVVIEGFGFGEDHPSARVVTGCVESIISVIGVGDIGSLRIRFPYESIIEIIGIGGRIASWICFCCEIVIGVVGIRCDDILRTISWDEEDTFFCRFRELIVRIVYGGSISDLLVGHIPIVVIGIGRGDTLSESRIYYATREMIERIIVKI